MSQATVGVWLSPPTYVSKNDLDRHETQQRTDARAVTVQAGLIGVMLSITRSMELLVTSETESYRKSHRHLT